MRTSEHLADYTVEFRQIGVKVVFLSVKILTFGTVWWYNDARREEMEV